MSVRKREWVTGKGTAKSAWIVDYVDTIGKRRQKTFAKKKDADHFAATASVEVREGTHVADSASVTVKVAGALWLASGATNELERSTLEQRQIHLRLHINPFIGETLLSKLTVPTVRSFEDALRKAKRSAIMTKKVLTSLGSILSDANERGLATRNPVRDIRGKRKGKEAKAEKRQKVKIEVGIDIPTREEIKAFVAALDDNWRPILLTLVFTGLRSSELRALRWRDVDLKRNEIIVRQRVDRYRVVGMTKSAASSRSVPVPPLVINSLKQLKIKQGGNSDLVFPNPDGNTRTHPNLVAKGIQPAMIRAGIIVDTGEVDARGRKIIAAKYPGSHAMRHFYASWLINRKEDGGLGMPAKMVQERMGHASITMTMDTYGHLFPRDDDGKELETAANLLIS